RELFFVAFLVTAMIGIVGVVFGLMSCYFRSPEDNVLMRILDFFNILPSLLFIIVFAAIVPKYSVWSFSLIMAAFNWMGIARIIRSKALAEREQEYVQASRTLGTSSFKTMFSHVLPNVSSLLILSMILKLLYKSGLTVGI